MWFKRRKRTEQDQALSESLRSLQTLLHDTGRTEPSLEPRADKAEDGEDPAPDSDRPVRRPVRLPGGEEADSGNRDTQAQSGNRWKDLSLSFDAEPVQARPRRPQADQETAGAPSERAQAGPVPQGLPGAGESTALPDQGSVNDRDSRSTSSAPAEPTAAHSPPPESELDLDDFADGSQAEPGLEIDAGLDADADTTAAASATPEASTIETGAEESANDGLRQAEGAAAPEWSTGDDLDAVEDGGGAVEADEDEEDQLHLELEPVESEHDIPTLTDAVYVPEGAPTESPGMPGPREAPYDERIDRCLEGLRVRLQLMGLEVLSPAQEAELHDALAELLHEPGRD